MPPSVLISTQNIHKSFSNTLLFNDLSMGILQGERIGLIGPNGAGKSTLLKILAGLEPIDQGELAVSSKTRIAYLPQIHVFDNRSTIRQILQNHFPDHMEDWEIKIKLNELNEQAQFPDLDLAFGTLSGGWKKRVGIAATIAEGCDLVLLDEPTNHLDLQGILWLEYLLQTAKFAFVLISHDRFILENTCNSIMDLDPRYKQGFLKVRGNYSQFLQDQERYLSDQRAEELSLSNKVRREIDWLRHGPKARTSKAKYRIDKAYGMIDDLTEMKRRNNLQSDAGINFEAGDRRSKRLLYAKGLSKTRGGETLFKDLELLLSPGMKIGIMGANGSGKSSLIDILRGELKPDQGEMEVAQGVRIITLDQNRELPDENLSLKRSLVPHGDTVIFRGNPLHISAWAQRFLFQKEQLELPVSQLSGGERARVLLANLMLETAEILILDEPTNDLDIPTLEVLEESLLDYSGALLLITHDRFLMDTVCDQIIYLVGDGTVKVFADTFQLTAFQSSLNTPEIIDKPRSPSDNKIRRQQLKTLRKSFSRVERGIEKAEARKAELEDELHDPANATDPVKLVECSVSIEKLNLDILAFLESWEGIGDEISQIEGLSPKSG